MLGSLILADSLFGAFIAEIDLTANSTSEISSPYFPGKYPRNSYFLWSVVAPSEYRIKIEFSKFEMSSCHNCECDFLIVRDGSSKDSKLLGKYCSHPGSLYTSGNHMWMEFASALTDRQRSDSIGFKATVSRGRNILTAHMCLWLFICLLLNIVEVDNHQPDVEYEGQGIFPF